ncbi:hypothetical protein BC834DRAFT_295453 [Gloeopeniophorella convolvens]|nr:hypothetical protein BC834DRAFT_295453 [Gloeopeniophorella convolvens]
MRECRACHIQVRDGRAAPRARNADRPACPSSRGPSAPRACARICAYGASELAHAPSLPADGRRGVCVRTEGTWPRGCATTAGVLLCAGVAARVARGGLRQGPLINAMPGTGFRRVAQSDSSCSRLQRGCVYAIDAKGLVAGCASRMHSWRTAVRF